MPAPSSSVGPTVSTADGRPIYKRTKAVAIPAGQAGAVAWQFVDSNGDPLDLSSLSAGSVKFKVFDAVSLGAISPVAWSGTFVSAAAGTVSLPLDPSLVALPSVQTVDAVVMDGGGVVRVTNRFSLFVDRSAWASTIDENGPPALSDVRLHLRDSGPEDNWWLDNEEFDLAEICQAAEKCVRFWNETLPPIDQNFTTATWPWRARMLTGMTGYLYQMAARHYRRVHLPYSAAGLTVDDKNKAQEYQAIGDAMWQEFAGFVTAQKVSMNASAAIGTLGSAYGLSQGLYSW